MEEVSKKGRKENWMACRQSRREARSHILTHIYVRTNSCVPKSHESACCRQFAKVLIGRIFAIATHVILESTFLRLRRVRSLTSLLVGVARFVEAALFTCRLSLLVVFLRSLREDARDRLAPRADVWLMMRIVDASIFDVVSTVSYFFSLTWGQRERERAVVPY